LSITAHHVSLAPMSHAVCGRAISPAPLSTCPVLSCPVLSCPALPTSPAMGCRCFINAFAWGFMLPVGALMARFTKTLYPGMVCVTELCFELLS
jgi:hypothetical protein